MKTWFKYMIGGIAMVVVIGGIVLVRATEENTKTLFNL